MGEMFSGKKDRLYTLTVAAFFLFLFLSLWFCGTVKAGEKEAIRQGFYQDMDGALYYYDRYGQMVTEEFVMITDRDGEYRYYFGADGEAARGLTEVADAWYFFDENGVMFFSGIRIFGAETWYFGEDGKADWVLERFE